jgi:hypothetical protein
MRRCAFLLVFAGVCVAAASPKTFVGTVQKNEPARSALATQCPVIKAPKYTLQTDTEAWVLTDEQLAAKYAGKRVVISGTVSNGNQLKAISVSPAK